jgi:hypothetical protein
MPKKKKSIKRKKSIKTELRDTLRWKTNPNDPAGFVGTLTQSFTLTETEGSPAKRRKKPKS